MQILRRYRVFNAPAATQYAPGYVIHPLLILKIHDAAVAFFQDSE